MATAIHPVMLEALQSRPLRRVSMEDCLAMAADHAAIVAAERNGTVSKLPARLREIWWTSPDEPTDDDGECGSEALLEGIDFDA